MADRGLDVRPFMLTVTLLGALVAIGAAPAFADQTCATGPIGPCIRDYEEAGCEGPGFGVEPYNHQRNPNIGASWCQNGCPRGEELLIAYGNPSGQGICYDIPNCPLGLNYPCIRNYAAADCEGPGIGIQPSNRTSEPNVGASWCERGCGYGRDLLIAYGNPNGDGVCLDLILL